jgi:2-polyprenyl-6-methoxyphenol hydroxylase-like FAD-dependent oxidoreductase
VKLGNKDQGVVAENHVVQEWWGSGRRLLVWPLGGDEYAVVGQHLARLGPGMSRRPTPRTWKLFCDEFQPYFDAPLTRQIFAALRQDLEGPCMMHLTMRARQPWPAVHPSKPICLIGDAVHSSYGASLVGPTLEVEDALTLAEQLATCKQPVELRSVLERWEGLRQQRWTQAVAYIRRLDTVAMRVGTVREGLRSIAMRWGGNSLVRKDMRIAHPDKVEGLTMSVT